MFSFWLEHSLQSVKLSMTGYTCLVHWLAQGASAKEPSCFNVPASEMGGFDAFYKSALYTAMMHDEDTS